jgi:hypothetical protein
MIKVKITEKWKPKYSKVTKFYAPKESVTILECGFVSFSAMFKEDVVCGSSVIPAGTPVIFQHKHQANSIGNFLIVK